MRLVAKTICLSDPVAAPLSCDFAERRVAGTASRVLFQPVAMTVFELVDALFQMHGLHFLTGKNKYRYGSHRCRVAVTVRIIFLLT